MGAATERSSGRGMPQESLADHRCKSKMLIPYDRATSRESRKSSAASDRSASSPLDVSQTVGKESARNRNHSIPSSPGEVPDKSTLFNSASPFSPSMLSPAFSSNRSSPVVFGNADEPSTSIASSGMRLPLDTLSTLHSTKERERSVSAKERVSSRGRQRSGTNKNKRIESLVVPIDSSRSDNDIHYPLV